MSSNLPKPDKPPYNSHRDNPKNNRIYQTVPTKPPNPLNFVTNFDRNPDTPKSDTTTLLNKDTTYTNCNCCSPFRPRRKKLSKSGKKVGKKSDKKSGKVRKNKRKTRL